MDGSPGVPLVKTVEIVSPGLSNKFNDYLPEFNPIRPSTPVALVDASDNDDENMHGSPDVALQLLRQSGTSNRVRQTDPLNREGLFQSRMLSTSSEPGSENLMTLPP
jgi:hypothetical protein